MRRVVLILCIFFVVSSLVFVPAPSAAQAEFEWNMGFTEGENITVILDEDGEASIEFWISNDYPTEITVSIGYTIPFNGQSSGPEEATIAEGDNETFTLEISDVDVLANRADKSGQFKVNVVLESMGGIPCGILCDSDEETGDLKIPRVRGFSIEITEPSGAMNAGTQLDLDMKISNTGNDVDAILDPTFESKVCPQLTIDGLNQIEDVAIDAPIDGASGVKTFTISVVAPQSHPSKVCDVSISIRSLGEANSGSISAAADDKINLEVRKANSGGSSGSDNSDSSNSGGGADDDSGDVITGNFTPAAGMISLFSVLFTAALLLRDDTE